MLECCLEAFDGDIRFHEGNLFAVAVEFESSDERLIAISDDRVLGRTVKAEVQLGLSDGTGGVANGLVGAGWVADEHLPVAGLVVF